MIFFPNNIQSRLLGGRFFWVFFFREFGWRNRAVKVTENDT